MYIALYALALWMLFSMRSTFLYANPRHTSELNQDAVSVLALSVLASLTALFILQGSNPGYLTTGACPTCCALVCTLSLFHNLLLLTCRYPALPQHMHASTRLVK